LGDTEQQIDKPRSTKHMDHPRARPPNELPDKDKLQILIVQCSELTKSFPNLQFQFSAALTGGRLVKHARYYWLLLAEGHLTRRRFGAMLGRITLLPIPTG
jgi:hypothetical protein